jgi:hypothetical protein
MKKRTPKSKPSKTLNKNTNINRSNVKSYYYGTMTFSCWTASP